MLKRRNPLLPKGYDTRRCISVQTLGLERNSSGINSDIRRFFDKARLLFSRTVVIYENILFFKSIWDLNHSNKVSLGFLKGRIKSIDKIIDIKTGTQCRFR